MPKLDHFRAFPRQPVALDANVFALTGQSWQAGARVLNLSPKGACLELRQAVEKGDRLRVAISIPALWDPLELEAVAVWTRSEPPLTSPQVGVCFSPLESAALRIFVQLLETQP